MYVPPHTTTTTNHFGAIEVTLEDMGKHRPKNHAIPQNRAPVHNFTVLFLLIPRSTNDSKDSKDEARILAAFSTKQKRFQAFQLSNKEEYATGGTPKLHQMELSRIQPAPDELWYVSKQSSTHPKQKSYPISTLNPYRSTIRNRTVATKPQHS